ncbi:AraC family transcriptional regulator [Gracilibacillus sp. YIM 98692]|uniref:helix-turn-helix domain-containing protein n=1 Tax=Gracilibacillus sp. YIM 98692 TaxID=2663532 RepID=UPI0013D749D3|nr:AraC family transcriptional regulator [Gracilibacillus sp. YIM 98692]
MHEISQLSKMNAFSSFSFVYKSTKDPQKELPEHTHDFYEIVYVYKGKGVLFVDDTFYQMRRGDVFIIPNNTIHHATPEEDDPITSSVIFISPDSVLSNTIEESYSFSYLFELIKNKKDYKIILEQPQYYQLESKLLNIYKELLENQVGAKHASLLIIQQIILDLYRIYLRKNQESKRLEEFAYSWINEILRFIDKNLHKRLTLMDLANQALVSPAHLSRVFKETTGMSLTSYINKKRTLKAKELLINDIHDTIDSIAERTGFQSMPHFYRTFKTYMGTTPSKFRKQSKL